MKNADLHCHSYYSDGVLSPKEVIMRAKEREVKNIALTDHNSVEGVREAIEEGKKMGVRVIPAVELKFDGGEILGYLVDIDNLKFLESLNKIKEVYNKRLIQIFEEVKDKIGGTLQELEEKFPHAKDNLTWTHLLYFMYEKKFRDSLAESNKFLFANVKWKKEKNISVEEAIKTVIEGKGIPILAHPWITKKSKDLLEEPRLKELVHIGLKGVEIDQGDRNEKRDKDFINKIKERAKKYDLILTSGSDFHGDFLIDTNEDKDHHELGSHNCDENIVTELEKN